jgi:transcriptional regulator with XRE-family HTH domain
MANPPKFRPSPLLDDLDQAAFVVKPDRPDKDKPSEEGSGSNFLSNEIFYRASLLRNATKPTLSSGHLHIPPFVTSTTQNPISAQRDRLLNGTQSIVERFLAKIVVAPTITSFSPLSGRVGTRVTILGANFTDTLAVLIGGGEVGFQVELDDRITATVSIDATTGPIQVQTPNGTAISEHFFTVIRGPRGDLGQELLAKRTELGLTPKAAAEQIGVSAGTYRRWEQGKDRPSTRFHSAVVNFLGHDPDRDPKEFGQKIREARERGGLTRTQLAAQLGVASSTVKAWENGTVTRPNARVETIFEDYLNET